MNYKLRKLSLILTVPFLLSQATFADCVTKGKIIDNGEIKFVASGLIITGNKGKENVYAREVSDEYFNDTIFYKKKLFKFEVTEEKCRISSVDKMNIIFYTEGNQYNKISKIRVKEMKINVF